MIKTLKKIKRGFFAGIKQGSGLHPDAKVNTIQAGALTGLAVSFVVRWAIVALIVSAVVANGLYEVLEEWALH